MDKPKNKIIKKALTRKAKLRQLSKITGETPTALDYFLKKKLKKGVKVLGNRLGSNIDSVSGYLSERADQFKGKIKKPPISKITRGPVTISGQLTSLAQAHDIPYKVIREALQAGAPPQTLLKVLNNESIPSKEIEQHLKDVTNRVTPKNKVVSGPRAGEGKWNQSNISTSDTNRMNKIALKRWNHHKRRMHRLDKVHEAREMRASRIASLKQGVAGVALYGVADKFLYPHTDKFGVLLGKKLKEQIDKRKQQEK